jgi:aminoglycoside/choline kinase family phosphotransferase
MSDFRMRLTQFLASRQQLPQFDQLTPDASTREYFRIHWDGGTAIACVYPESFVAGEQNYLDVTGLFRSTGLPVAEVYDFDEERGVIVQEDFGNTILREVLSTATPEKRDELLNRAIALIPRIQNATARAFEIDSIASRLKFDTEKLLWELEFFKEHYFLTLCRCPLPEDESDALSAEFLELSRELESRAKVLCHRDFHAANLMIDKNGELRIIDHQDARIGSTAYDLVSLLLDRTTEPPSPEWLADKRRFFLDERASVGLARLAEDDFAYEFRLQSIQRCLKANGTFSYQSVNRGKTYFLPFIRPMFEIVLRAAENLDRFPVLQSIVRRELQRDATAEISFQRSIESQ